MNFTDVIQTIPKKNWLHKWLGCWTLTEPPRSYLVYGALSFLGAVLGKKVWIDQDEHTIFPMLNLLLIGPAGIGKSTATDKICMRLLESIPEERQPQLILGMTTKPKLAWDLSKKPHALWIASELSDSFTRNDYQADLIPFVTRLLDQPEVIEGTRTKGDDVVRIENPAMTVVGGSTREWLQDMLPEAAGVGGFLRRFLILKEDHKHQRMPVKAQLMSGGQARALALKREEVLRTFGELCGREGSYAFDGWGAMDTYSYWSLAHAPASGLLAPFAASAPEFVLRLALLVAISSLETRLSAESIRAAVALWTYAEERLLEVVVPQSQAGKGLQKTLDAIGCRPITEKQLIRALRNYARAPDIRKDVESLIAGGEVVRLKDGMLRRTS